MIFMMVGYGVLLARIARIVIPLAALIGVLAALFGGGVSGGLMTFGRISLLGLTIAFAWTIDPIRRNWRAHCGRRARRRLLP